MQLFIAFVNEFFEIPFGFQLNLFFNSHSASINNSDLNSIVSKFISIIKYLED